MLGHSSTTGRYFSLIFPVSNRDGDGDDDDDDDDDDG